MNKSINLILFIICLSVASCSGDNNENDPISPFSLDKNYYEVRLERSVTSISVTNGSGDISMEIKDESILQATYTEDEYDKGNSLKGHVNLYGLRKGSTTLTITDNMTKDVETVEVKVTDCYLAYAVSDSNHPALEAGIVLFFVNNPEKDFYVFVKDNLQGKLYERPIAKGDYEFLVTPSDESTAYFKGIPALHLNIAGDDTEMSYDFQLKLQGEDATSSYALDFIYSYLGVEWKKLIDEHSRSLPPIDLTMTLTVPDSEYRITGVLSTGSIPEHILD